MTVDSTIHNDNEDDSRASVGDDEETKARKRKERLEQNRISARESRKRKKTMIEELQRTVITLSRENKELNERNESLRRQLMEIGAKVRVVWERAGEMPPFDVHGFCLVTLFSLRVRSSWFPRFRHRVS